MALTMASAALPAGGSSDASAQTPKIYVIHENEEWLYPLRESFRELNQPFVDWNLAHTLPQSLGGHPNSKRLIATREESVLNGGSASSSSASSSSESILNVIDFTQPPPEGVFYNRMSASSHTRGHRYSCEYCGVLLEWLESYNRTVINGSRALALEINKANQITLFHSVGIPSPKTIIVPVDNLAVGKASQADERRTIREYFVGSDFPLYSPFVLKHNRSGSGLGVRLFGSVFELEDYLASPTYEPPIDGILLVQEYVAVSHITRLEFIDNKLLYCLKINVDLQQTADTSSPSAPPVPAAAAPSPLSQPITASSNTQGGDCDDAIVMATEGDDASGKIAHSSTKDTWGGSAGGAENKGLVFAGFCPATHLSHAQLRPCDNTQDAQVDDLNASSTQESKAHDQHFTILNDTSNADEFAYWASHPFIGKIQQMLRAKNIGTCAMEFVRDPTDPSRPPLLIDVNVNTNYNQSAESRADLGFEEKGMGALALFLQRKLNEQTSAPTLPAAPAAAAAAPLPSLPFIPPAAAPAPPPTASPLPPQQSGPSLPSLPAPTSQNPPASAAASAGVSSSQSPTSSGRHVYEFRNGRRPEINADGTLKAEAAEIAESTRGGSGGVTTAPQPQPATSGGGAPFSPSPAQMAAYRSFAAANPLTRLIQSFAHRHTVEPIPRSASRAETLSVERAGEMLEMRPSEKLSTGDGEGATEEAISTANAASVPSSSSGPSSSAPVLPGAAGKGGGGGGGSVKLPAGLSFVTGMMGAVVAGAVTHPVDLVKVRMQLAGQVGSSSVAGGAAAVSSSRRLGMLGTAVDVAKTEGIMSLYKGMSGNVLRQVTFVGTKFGSYDVAKKLVQTYTGNESGQLGFAEKALCGLVAGGAGAAVGNPADMVMVRMQADGQLPQHLRRNYTNAASAMYQVAREEGVVALWRGCMPTVNRAMIVTAAQMACYDQTKEEILKHTSLKDGPLVHLSSSLVAGFVASVTSNPFDVAKTRLMQMQADPTTGQYPYRGTVDCLAKTVSGEGVGALYKGLGPTIARQVPLNMLRFMCVEQLRKLFTKLYQPRPPPQQPAAAE
ncbi:unnamed protein product [Vitrella brassicaformis CCMP3155]|uniref:ATP-grasp domain-containing protein n=1 Tax=Vitrella brassicaformis (strain CCMP3155) TaxID=1169540 RepID=A0A0G4EQD3_VITBC|nr:unnamed protein product [Vitrella brassicaformis CCMP3155]|eukprot:CEL99671.1 unnamed protein product [Vitrella brassicaformis CCMP3155]